MKIVTNPEEMRFLSRGERTRRGRLGLVPTMGALHEGHLSLVRAARSRSDVVAASIFVNPTQFGPTEDCTKGHRSMESACARHKKENVELVFARSVDKKYPKNSVTWPMLEAMSDRPCGKSRPGHFRGATTVVSKLFHIVEPD